MKTKLLISLVAVLFVSVLYLLYLNFAKKPEVAYVPKTGKIILPTTVPTTTDPTANWKTYTNTKYSFSFKYPQDYFKYVNEYQAGNSIYFAPTEGKGVEMGTPMALTPGDVWFTVDISLAKSGQKSTPKELISLDGPQPVSDFQSVIVENGNAIKIVLSSFSKDTLNKFESTFNQILSTFKFTSTPTPTTSISKVTYKLPSGWQTFSGPANQFTVGFNPSTQDASMQDGIVSIVYKNLQNNPYYSPYAQTQHFQVLPYNNGSRHAFIEKQLGETLSISKDNITSDTDELNIQIAGKNCLIINGVYISQFPTVWGMCVIDSTSALMFNSFNYADLSQHLSTLKF